MDTGKHSDSHAEWWRSRNSLVLLGFLAVAAYFLFTEYRAQVVQFLPYGLLLLCPLLHLFHGGHGGHGGDHPNRSGGKPK